MSDNDTLSTLIGELLVNLKTNNKTVNNVVDIITVCMELVEKYPNLVGQEKSDLVIKVLEEIAKGPDGILGSSDDIIPANIIEILKTVLSLGIVQNIIDQIIRATKGQLTLNNAVKFGSYLWNCMFGKLHK